MAATSLRLKVEYVIKIVRGITSEKSNWVLERNM
jgi:hypothetical protein